MRRRKDWIFYGKPLVFLLASLPALWLVWQWGFLLTGQPHELTFNPQEFTNRFTGIWALRLLLVSLAVSPVKEIIGRPWPIRFRRMLGLFAFFYACLHITSYVAADQLFHWPAIWEDIVKRNFITVGFAAFLGLIPLAVTSTKRMVKRIGAKRWQRLHRLIYVIAPLAALHFTMMAKGQQLEPLVYGVLVAMLLGFRVVGFWRRRRTRFSRSMRQVT